MTNNFFVRGNKVYKKQCKSNISNAIILWQIDYITVKYHKIQSDELVCTNDLIEFWINIETIIQTQKCKIQIKQNIIEYMKCKYHK